MKCSFPKLCLCSLLRAFLFWGGFQSCSSDPLSTSGQPGLVLGLDSLLSSSAVVCLVNMSLPIQPLCSLCACVLVEGGGGEANGQKGSSFSC